MTGSCSIVILTVAEDLLNLPGFKIFSHTYLTDEWSTHHTLVFEREFKQYGDTLVCTSLVFGCHIKKDIIPAVAPIFGKMLRHTFGAFCQQKEYHITAYLHQLPRFITPLVSLGKKEIRGHANSYLLSAFYLVISLAVFLYRIVEACLSPIYIRAVLISHLVKKIHIAMVTALAFLDTPVPRVPDIMHIIFLSAQHSGYSELLSDL